jgi:hypothetical protein
MRSIFAEDAQAALPIPPLGSHPRLDRVAAATFEQLSAALIFLSVFEPDAFDHSMDVAQSSRRHCPRMCGSICWPGSTTGVRQC